MCHRNLESYLRTYLEGCGISGEGKAPLFRTIGKTTGKLTLTPLPQPNAYAMIGRRARAAGIKIKVGNHTFRATGIAAYCKMAARCKTPLTWRTTLQRVPQSFKLAAPSKRPPKRGHM